MNSAFAILKALVATKEYYRKAYTKKNAAEFSMRTTPFI